jgi:hypothetical protein
VYDCEIIFFFLQLLIVTMSTSSVLACLIVLCASQIGRGKEVSFVAGDRKFDHVWHTKQSMPGKRSDMTATTVDDAIYLVGGCMLDQEWVTDPPYSEYRCGAGAVNAVSGSTIRYFPKTNTFDTTLPDAPRPRYRHAAAAVNKKIYLFGGTGSSGSIVKEVDVLDTVKGKWTTLGQRMPNATTDLSAFAHSGDIYTVGGYDASWKALNRVQIFSPSAQEPWQSGPQLLQGRGDVFAAVVDNKAYVVGGFHHENKFTSPVPNLEMLDVGPGAAWVPRKAMKVARGDKAVASLNNILHVVGGEGKNSKGHSVPLRDVEAYDPVGNVWYYGGDIPSERFRFVAAAHGNSIFIFGGQAFLLGQHGTDGSKYPIVDTVEEYSETVSSAVASKAISLRGRSSYIHFEHMFVMLSAFWLQVHR